MHSTLAFLLLAVVFVHNTVALKYLPIGCFRDTLKRWTPRALPKLIKNFRGNLDWSNLNKTIDECAKEAKKKNYVYFGIQFYGECWSGPMAHVTYDRDGPSKNCSFGVGGSFTNFVYRLTGEENECSAYNTLQSADRSQMHNTSFEHAPRCDHWGDSFAHDRWNRFEGAAGQTIADKRVNPMHCQTYMSGWMKGEHPKVVDGIQSREVCFSWRKSECARSTKIRVRNCGKFYVYFLPSTPGCHLRYCGSGIKQSSRTAV